MKGPSLRILVVDDEPEIRRFLRATLRARPVSRSSRQTTGAGALEMAAESRPDLIILDLGLPDMDGVEVTRRIRARSQTPIIILSVRNHENDKIMALDAGPMII